MNWIARFTSERRRVWPLVASTPGYLSRREAEFLMLAAAGAPAEGVILEIGSYRGRSTVALASLAKAFGRGRVIAVDPHTSPSETDPGVAEGETSFDDFLAAVRRAQVEDVVVPRRMLSSELRRDFNDPIRLLWIDGDHTLEGARADLEMYQPFLAPNAIVAMHDVLGTFAGSLTVFCDDVLGSDAFGPAGFCGSIGWAQYRPDDGHRYRGARTRLRMPARRLIPVAERGRVASGLDKWRYKFWRTLAPHGDVDPAGWLARVGS